ncbi:death-associated protein 1 [Eurytemora carolleeae]|uniref:death-associated protein 1 n=1 Tax=Eurytemora carolleeae TaxID=1294199 RepID=UPI000C778959|nr:death-associated protein 1 [Eurytemora carolleeae]|eukprot:XP_023329185.1 death-associated protein 1-like [Eurytemora affinis]
MGDTDAQDLKGGHAPALKVGGMRVVQKAPREDKSESPVKPTDEEIEEFGEDKKEKNADIVVSGAKMGVEEAFPKAAIQAFHEKPVPTHQMGASNKPKIIQQPCKK